MFLSKSGKFEIDNVEFEIPAGFYLSGNPEVTYEAEMYLQSPNKDYSVSIHRLIMRKSVEKTMTNSVNGVMDIIDSIRPIEQNGLKGLYHTFKERRFQYFEVGFCPENNSENFIAMEIITGEDIQDILNSSEFKELLGSFKKAGN